MVYLRFTPDWKCCNARTTHTDTSTNTGMSHKRDFLGLKMSMDFSCYNVRGFDYKPGQNIHIRDTRCRAGFFPIREKQEEGKRGEKALAHVEVLSTFLPFFSLFPSV